MPLVRGRVRPIMLAKYTRDICTRGYIVVNVDIMILKDNFYIHKNKVVLGFIHLYSKNGIVDFD